MNLSDAMPRDLIAERFVGARESVVADDVKSLRRHLPSVAGAVSIFSWDEMLYRGVIREGDAMRRYYPSKPDKAFQLVWKKLGRMPITAAYCAKWFSDLDQINPFIQINLCQCYPNDIHIHDIVFADLTRPANDQSRLAPRSHRGLGLFGPFFEQLLLVAKFRGLSRISLIAASPAAHEFFTKFGFEVSPTQVGKHAFQNFGHSHPMFYTIKE